jgi:peptidoglycan/xylan/chitin deacetylase (PgdA/CDA1 family)
MDAFDLTERGTVADAGVSRVQPQSSSGNSFMATIVTYHYVRDLTRSRYPRIKGLDLRLFREQLQYLRRHYVPIAMEQLLAACSGGEPLPRNAVLLTFDDGYADHFQYVLPILEEYAFSGCFFPAGQPCLEGRMLDVNKIHHLLASITNPDQLVAELFAALDARRSTLPLESNEEYWGAYACGSRFDGPPITFIKRMLQVVLPAPLRQELIDELFRRHVTYDEHALAQELYLSLDQLRCMRRHGMYIGGHSYAHPWLNKLDPEAQAQDVDRMLEFLGRIGYDPQAWVMCYPYGGHDPGLRAILRRKGCVAGLTTEQGIAAVGHDPLLLPRLDTNDLPQHGEAPPNEWTARVLR